MFNKNWWFLNFQKEFLNFSFCIRKLAVAFYMINEIQPKIKFQNIVQCPFNDKESRVYVRNKLDWLDFKVMQIVNFCKQNVHDKHNFFVTWPNPLSSGTLVCLYLKFFCVCEPRYFTDLVVVVHGIQFQSMYQCIQTCVSGLLGCWTFNLAHILLKLKLKE